MSNPAEKFAVVLGATGYVGGELLRLISGHPAFTLAAAVSESRAGDRVAAVFPHLAAAYADKTFVSHDDWLAAVDNGADLALFSAAPHGASAAIINAALDGAASKNIHVHAVDCSADFRYPTPASYESVYGCKHGAANLLSEFYCGLPEHVGGTPARHIGHPGCFATAILLASMPLLKSGLSQHELFVSAVTGSTGSGRSPLAGTHHPERHSNMYAYKPLEHRHTPEIVRLLAESSGQNAIVNFVPHSGPFARGIYATVQAKSNGNVSAEQLKAEFLRSYADTAFVEVVEGTPKLKNVVASNRCQIGVSANEDTLVVMCAIDNLIKGAAGGAIQWMNRLWGIPETTGLTMPAPAWI